MNISLIKTHQSHKEHLNIRNVSDELASEIVARFFGRNESPNNEVKKTKEVDVNGIVKQAKEKVLMEQTPVKGMPTIVNKNGLNLYTVKIECGACGSESSRLTTPTNTFVKCKSCEQKLELEQMFEQHLLADKDGYAFKAHSPYFTEYEKHKLEHEMSNV